MTSESHRMEVVAEAKHRRKAIVWEVAGLLLVLAAGLAVLAVLAGSIKGRYDEIVAEKIRQAGEAKPEFAPVDVTPAAAETVRDTIQLPGLVFADVAAKTPAEVAGRVLERLVENGQTVKKGDVILRIDPRDYRIRMRRAESALGLVKLQRERIGNLARQKAVSQSELDAVETELERAAADYDDAALALERCEVRSPLDGGVVSIKPEVGEWLESGAIVAEIADISKVKIRVGISEGDLFSVRSLESCDMTADSIRGGYRFTGRKTYLSLAPADNTQVYVLELEVDNPDRLLLPGMFVEADVLRGVRNNSMMVPAFTVMTTPDSAYEVAVARDLREEPATETGPDGEELPPLRHGVARRVPVRLGLMRGSEVEIVLAPEGATGLRPGDLLIVNGQRNLDDGAPIRLRRELGAISDIDR